MIERFDDWLMPEEIEAIRGLANGNEWQIGRQGTSYEKLDLSTSTSSIVASLRSICLSVMGYSFAGNEDDCYLIRYPTGSCVPPHTDPVKEDRRHMRFNMLITVPESGGELWINKEYVRLYEGDGVLFCPSELEHEVKKIDEGERLVFSIGCLISRTIH